MPIDTWPVMFLTQYYQLIISAVEVNEFGWNFARKLDSLVVYLQL